MGSQVAIKPIALSVHPDEPSWGLSEQSEMVALPDGSRQYRWVQRVRVVRDDRKAEFVTDFGPAGDFDHIPPLFLLSVGTDSVAQLQEEAERHRHDLKWLKRRQEMAAESTLISDILRREEEKRDWIASRSRFGPGGAVRRNA